MSVTRAEPIVPPVEEAAAAPPRKTEVVFSLPTVMKALAVFFGVIVIFLVRDALLSIALAIVMVLGLDPPVSALERRGWGRGKAAMCVLGGVVLTVFVIVVWAVRPLWEAFGGFLDKLPGYVEEARTSPVLEDIDKGTEAFQKLEATLADAARSLPETAIHLLGAAATVVGSVFSLVTLAFLTLFGIIAKPQLTRAGLELMRPHHAARFERTLGDVANAVSFTLLGNIAISVIAGTVVGISKPARVDTIVDIEVFDARTGVRLGGAEATVSAKIVVEDELE